VRDFDLETCQKAAIYLRNLSSVRLSTFVEEGQDFDVQNAVECMRAFINNGKLRSATFKIFSKDEHFERGKPWRQKLMHHLEVKKWSKVTRVRCELCLGICL